MGALMRNVEYSKSKGENNTGIELEDLNKTIN